MQIQFALGCQKQGIGLFFAFCFGPHPAGQERNRKITFIPEIKHFPLQGLAEVLFSAGFKIAAVGQSLPHILPQGCVQGGYRSRLILCTDQFPVQADRNAGWLGGRVGAGANLKAADPIGEPLIDLGNQGVGWYAVQTQIAQPGHGGQNQHAHKQNKQHHIFDCIFHFLLLFIHVQASPTCRSTGRIIVTVVPTFNSLSRWMVP